MTPSSHREPPSALRRVGLISMVGPYVTLRTLVPAPRGFSIGSLQPARALDGLRRLGLTPQTGADAACDRLLLRACQDNADVEALLNLRCRASEPIEQQVRLLHGRWGASHHLDLLEMASRVLDDDGRPLGWQGAVDGPGGHEPFSLPVLRQWRPELASLDRWCRVRVQSDPHLRQLLLHHGLLLIGPWALLASASRSRVEDAWRSHGQGPLTSAGAVALHSAYRELYGEAKARHQRERGRSRGWLPDQAFLVRLRPDAPAFATLEQLLAIAAALRRWRLAGPAPEDSPCHRTIATTGPDEAEEGDELSELAALIDPALRRACARRRGALLAAAPGDARLLRCLWEAYGQGLSQRASAERCGCSQAMVSRRLQLRRQAKALATTAALDLGRHPVLARRLTSIATSERFVEALADHLLAPPPDDPRPRLAVWLLSDPSGDPAAPAEA
ncbi:MAG: hypothetical protein FJ083_16995 [Cyanobacteria bacterium K_Offshore_surface_m2_239]|nr:hypothetical protein [Cyanobacteria bacterium K_Offshore_surface_m2_239]